MRKPTRRAVAASLRRACPVALGCWSILAAGAGVSEAGLYWDINGPTAGSGGPTPSGTWDSATPNWSTDPTGVLPTQAWTSGETAFFSAGFDATGMFTVTVSGTQVAAGLSFLTPGQPVLVGGGIQLGLSPIHASGGVSAILQLTIGGNTGLFAAGPGLITLATANTYTGATNVSGGGSLDLKHLQALGASSGVSVISGSALLIDSTAMNVSGVPITSLNGAGPTSAGALRNIFGVNTFGGNITIGSGGARIGSDGAGTLTLSGTVNGGPLTFTGAGNFNLTGSIQTGTAGVTKAGFGTLTLTQSSTNTGTWSLSGGTVKLAASQRIADSAPLSFAASTATFDMAGFGETIGSLSGSGKIVNAGALAVGVDGSSTTFGGTITGNGALTKIGSGTLSLRGENTYSGLTTISAGSISLTSLGRLGATTTGTVVADGASLILLDNVVVNEPITISGNGVNNAGGAIRRTGFDTATYAGPITLAAPARIGAESTLIVSGNTNNSGFDLTIGGNSVISFSGAISGAGGLIKDGTDIVLLLSNQNLYTGNTTVTAGKLIVNGTVLNSTVTVAAGATLGGSGVLAHGVTINAGGHIAPGPGTGGVAALSVEGLTLLSHSMLDFELATPAASDKISIGKSSLHLNGQEFSDFIFTKLSGFTPGEFVLIDAASIVGSLGPNVSGSIGGTPATIAIQGNDLVLLAPEPTSGAALATIGLTLLAARRRSPLGGRENQRRATG